MLPHLRRRWGSEKMGGGVWHVVAVPDLAGYEPPPVPRAQLNSPVGVLGRVTPLRIPKGGIRSCSVSPGAPPHGPPKGHHNDLTPPTLFYRRPMSAPPLPAEE